MRDDESEPLKLPDAVKYVFEECRMVLPGIQALFGFQMIAVFNNGFSEKLTASQKALHGFAILLVVFAIALVMSPAAIHRRAEPRSASDRFLRVSSTLLLAAMMLLAAGLSLDVYLVTFVVWQERAIALIASIGAFVVFILLWEVYPAIYRRQLRTREGSRSR
jgi:hypothetical protein